MVKSAGRPSRRGFMAGLGAGAAAAGLLAALPDGAADAVAAAKGRGSLDDVEHVVILMQENRSFDHYYGTMRGVRGFGDPTRAPLSTQRDVLYQPDPTRLDGGYLLPFHVDTRTVDGQDLADLAHDWDTTHLAWNNGRYDGWPTAKTEMSMGYFTATDIPFQRALAAAFTVCDAYHCSIQGPTTPNRLYHWTGMIDPAGTAGGPATANPPDYQPVYSWTTYPERLQKAGISWQVYANDEVGDGTDGYVGDYGDNPLWLFHAYHDALASTDPSIHQLAERASLRTTWKSDSGRGKNVNHVLAEFESACAKGTLPAVSWVVAPYLYSEHPAARPVDGAAYTQAVLRALWRNPALWAKTVVLINYDENDGFFDHVPPPVPPPGTPGEFLPAIQPAYGGLPPAFGPPTPIGLGPRVPMTVISPWSHGGWVNSQVQDHTSVLRFLETWTGVREPNISAWRRRICGDLTGCFDFATTKTVIPSLPDANVLRTAADRTQTKLPTPSPPPTGKQVLPVQDSGRANARPIPYQSLANFSITNKTATVKVGNQGGVTFPFQIYARRAAGMTVTPIDVSPASTALIPVALEAVTGAYDVEVHGPNGFLAHATGNAVSNRAAVDLQLSITGTATHPTILLSAVNRGSAVHVVQSTDIAGHATAVTLAPGAKHSAWYDPLATDHGWYDVTVTVTTDPGYLRRYSGHLENGRASLTR